MRLVSRAHLEFKTGSTAALPLDELVGTPTACWPSPAAPAACSAACWAAGRGRRRSISSSGWPKLFDGRLYLELQRHGEDNERRIEGPLLDLAYAKGLPIVGTNDVHFPKESMYEAHDVLLCIEQGAHIEDPNRRRLTPEHYFKSAAQMREVFADLPEACDNTLVDRPALRLHARAAQADPAELHQAAGPLGGRGAARSRADAASRS